MHVLPSNDMNWLLFRSSAPVAPVAVHSSPCSYIPFGSELPPIYRSVPVVYLALAIKRLKNSWTMSAAAMLVMSAGREIIRHTT